MTDDILLNYSSNSEQPMPLIVSQIFYLIVEFLSLQKRHDQFRDLSAFREQQAADICPRGRKIRNLAEIYSSHKVTASINILVDNIDIR